MNQVSLPDEVRAACAWVAGRARSVRIDEEAIAAYAAGLPKRGPEAEAAPFADNLVPHVLRVDGILHLDHDLLARIEAEDLLEHDSPEEVELRACAVQAVELLAAASSLTPAEIDSALWNRGRERRYKSPARPRSSGTAY